MRIGIVAPPWIPVPPRAYGGIESFIDTLARELDAMGHELLLAASGDSECPVRRVPGFPPSDPELMGVTTHELRHLIRAYASLADMDVVIENTLAGPIVARSARTRPVVTVAHGPFIPLVQELYRAASEGMSYVAISHHQASTAGDIPIARVIHHGIRAAEVPVGPGGREACFLGRMHPDKGLPEAIRIAELAGVPLRIAAKMREPAEREYFDEVVRPLLGPNAEYLGELDTQEKYELVGQSSVLLNPIQWDEPFGLVMVESLATGTPVVATPRGSVPEIIDDGRTGFVRSSFDELAEAVSRAGDLDRAVCRADVEERFTSARMAREYVGLFEALLDAETTEVARRRRAAHVLPDRRTRVSEGDRATGRTA
jgi:glycosyltransferase involved in cell wall biosynthesis